MNKNILNNALLFLEKCDLKGKEVPAFIEVVNYLNKLINEDSNLQTDGGDKTGTGNGGGEKKDRSRVYRDAKR